MSEIQEKNFTISNRNIAGRLYQANGNNTYKTPIIALHGWLDNANTFKPLQSCLTDCTILALDLAGHGRSDHRSADSAYNLWQDVGEILAVAEQMDWQQFTLLGHSRGAMISILLAAVAADRVRKLMLIDGLVPIPVTEADAPQQLVKAIADKSYYSNHQRRRYNSLDAAVEVRTKGDFPLSLDSAYLLAERGVSSDENGYYWASDPRLQGASDIKFTDGQLHAFLHQVSAPVLLILANEKLAVKEKLFNSYWQQLKQCQLHKLDGGHHLHMDGAQQQVAAIMREFMQSAGATK